MQQTKVMKNLELFRLNFDFNVIFLIILILWV